MSLLYVPQKLCLGTNLSKKVHFVEQISKSWSLDLKEQIFLLVVVCHTP